MNKQKKLVVVGLGYVGLPLAVLAKEKDWEVSGLDVNQEKINKINSQVVPFKDDELDKRLKEYPILATAEASVVKEAAIIVIAVPTPVDKFNHPDLEPLVSAISSILPYLHSGQVVAVESTVNPGVMDEVVRPLLAKVDGVHLVHCPERINPGDAKWSVRNIPRVIGGYSQEGVKLAVDFYTSVLEAPVKIMRSATEAEAVKILENTFRDVNIAFINEMAMSFAVLGVDITNVIEGAATKPFAFMPHYPGNGVGGHCISVDPYYMIERARQAGFNHRFLKLAREINEGMPAYTVSLLEKGMEELKIETTSAYVALLGLSYKKNVGDLRNSPAFKILDMLKECGMVAQVFDPFVPSKSTTRNLSDAVSGCAAVILSCDHAAIVKELTPAFLKRSGVRLVVDGRNALDMDGVARAGIGYYGIGRSKKAETKKIENRK